MHILYFGCLATDLLDFFYKHTTLCCYGNYEEEEYPSKCFVICSLLLLSMHEQNFDLFNCLRLFDINF